jgi:hypothetical protein
MQKVTIYTNYPFDSSYENTRLFNSVEEQQEYFADRVYTTLNDVNFIYNDLIETKFEFVFEDGNISDLLNCNYLSVEDLTEDRDDITLYYYIVNSKLNSYGQVEMLLKLDVMQTYLMYLKFDHAFIQRAHLDRFDEHTNGTTRLLTFKGDKNSKFFKSEPLNFTAQYPVYRRELRHDLSEFTNKDGYNDIILGWIKIFVDSSHTYTYSSQQFIIDNCESYGVGNEFDLNTGVILLPILATGYSGEISYTFNGVTNNYPFEQFLLPFICKIINPSYIYDIQFSYELPIEFYQDNVISIDTTTPVTPTVRFNIDSLVGYNYSARVITSEDICLVCARYINRQETWYIESSADIGLFTLFPRISPNDIYSDGVAKTRNPLFNPKLYNMQFSMLKIDNVGSDDYDYNLLALTPNIFRNFADFFTGSRRLKFIGNCVNTVMSQNTFFRVKGYGTSLYNTDCEDNLNIGCVNTEVLSIPFVSNQLQEYVAEHKNWIMQALLQPVVQGGKNIVSAKSNAEALSALGGAVVDTVVAGINVGLQEDNMFNAPNNLKNSSNAFYFKMSNTFPKPYATCYTLTPKEQKELDDFCNYYGFTLNELDSPNAYFKTRMYHNYIKFMATNFSVQYNGTKKPLSETLKAEIRSIMANGIRIWHVDEIDFTKENPELSIWGDN